MALLGAIVAHGLSFLAGYLSGQKSFPQPLSPSKERIYLEKMETGDCRAREELIAHNLRLVAHVAKKFDHTTIEAEDLISIGTIGLIKGIDTFDRRKGVRLATYVARCIENEILMALRRMKGKQESSLEDPIGTDQEGNEISLLDVLCTDDEPVPDSVNRELLRERMMASLDVLSPRERRVVEMRYGLNGKRMRTQREIAQMLDISRSYVSRIQKRSVGKLSQVMHRYASGSGITL